MNSVIIKSPDSSYPPILRQRLGERAPNMLSLMGDAALLARPKTALFCSTSCPDETLSRARLLAQKLVDDSVTVISGFHSPVEKECLRILLGGTQPIVVCLLRALTQTTRIPADWQTALDSGRLLLVSCFEKPRRPDRETARKRNEFVAALSDEILIIHAKPGGSVERIAEMARGWGIPSAETGPVEQNQGRS
ncbi:MAG: hypothetical protein FJ145_10935 [Deltaproteobacteria bacterium]|nr:hypothetical protein [Deltaproteobacteria bacterium]